MGNGSTINGTYALTLNGPVTVSYSGSGSTGATISCPVILTTTPTFTVADDGTAALDLTLSGGVGGAFGITKAGAGQMCLTGDVAATGGSLTTNGNYTVRTFTSTGTFTVTDSGNVGVLVVAGGGGGGESTGGGGGAGGLLYKDYNIAPFAVSLAQAYTVTVGAGGTAASGRAGTQGSNSIFSTLDATGGGGGGMVKAAVQP